MKTKRRTLLAILIGNAFEYYDFCLYSMFSIIFARLFFKSDNFLVSMLWLSGTFSISYIVRPLGAMIFGHIGDTLGRKQALTFSIFLSALPMFVIGLMPSYETIGIMAPCMIVIMRIIQGIAFGGEGNGAGVFCLEWLTKGEKRSMPGLISGIIVSSSNIGTLIALFMYQCVIYFENISWGWRIPFILGSLIGFLGVYMRLNIKETLEFEEMKKNEKPYFSLMNILKKYPKSFLTAFFMGALIPSLPYVSYLFSVSYMFNYHHVFTPNISRFYLYSIVIVIMTAPLFGAISDYCSRRGYFAMTILGVLGITPAIFELWRENSEFSLTLAHILIGASYASITGGYHAFLQRLFPVEVRYRGVSISYCLGGSMIAGFAPFIITFLTEKTGNINTLVFFICACAIFLLLAIINLGNIDHDPRDRADEFQGHDRKKLGL